MRLFHRTTIDLSPKLELDDHPVHETSKAGTVTIENEYPLEIATEEDLITTIELQERSKSSQIARKLAETVQCKKFKRILFVIVILNIVQLIIFFIVTTVILPSRTKKLLDSEDTGFILNHVPDEYVDYDYFRSMIGS